MNKFVRIACVTVFTAITAYCVYQSQKDNLQIPELVCWRDIGDCRRLGQYYRDCEFTGYQYMYCTTICNL